MNSSTQVDFARPFGFAHLLGISTDARLPEWPAFEAHIELRDVARGETLFAQDVPHPFVYVVRSGLIKLCYLNGDGDEWIKAFIAEGQFFASIAALSAGGRTTFMAAALEAGVVEQVAFAEIAALAERYLEWSRALSALTLTYAARKEQRERELLTLSVEQRYVEFQRQHATLIDRIPQKELARHLGVTPVGLSRIVVRLRAETRQRAT